MSVAAPLLDPVLEQLRQWRAARSRFDTELEPKRADLHALDVVEQQKREIEAQGQARLIKAEDTWAKDGKNTHVRDMYNEANVRLARKKLEHGNETPTMLAYGIGYAIALLCIGVAEWLINYDVFYIFTGIPAIAAGATVILAALLAFAAHAHGEVLKQWSYRFSRARRDVNTASARLLALASLALIVVIGAAGGSRYAAVLRTLQGQSAENILGGVALIDVNPLRDVLLSLLANFAAWIVGVFISYYCHDRDPDFMAAQRQFDRARRRRDRRMAPLTSELTSISVATGEEQARADQSAATRFAGVKAEHDLLTQVDRHERDILQTLGTEAGSAAERFRAALCLAIQGRASGARPQLRTRDGQVVALDAYRHLPFDANALLGLEH